MEATFNIWKKNRKLYFSFLKHYSLEQLNTTPHGFTNNLVWNIGHAITVQQSLVYKWSGLDGYISDSFFEKYKPGTTPKGTTTQSEIDELGEFLFAHIDSTISDYKNGVFTTYHERKTGTGFHLTSVEDALNFNNYHEALHLGIMMSIRKFL